MKSVLLTAESALRYDLMRVAAEYDSIDGDGESATRQRIDVADIGRRAAEKLLALWNAALTIHLAERDLPREI